MTDRGSEEILGIIPAWIDKGGIILRKPWACDLIFTTNRLIVAEANRRGYSAFKSDHYISFSAGARDRLKMNQKPIDNFLKASPENYEINYSDIAVIEMKKMPGAPSHSDLLVFSPENLDVPMHTFSLAISDKYYGDFTEFLAKIVPDKI
jgi:hypothetical protein